MFTKKEVPERMNIHDAQQHARRWVKSLRAAEALEGVCDAVADAEARISGAEKAVKDAYAEVEVLELRKAELQQETLAIAATHEDLHLKSKHLSETYTSYKKQVDEDVAVLKGHLEDHVDRYDEALKSMAIRKEEFAVELKLLRAEKEKIESVVEAFQEASAKNQETKT